MRNRRVSQDRSNRSIHLSSHRGEALDLRGPTNRIQQRNSSGRVSWRNPSRAGPITPKPMSSAEARSPTTATTGPSRPTMVHSACMRPTWIANSVATKAMTQPRSYGRRSIASLVRRSPRRSSSGCSGRPRDRITRDPACSAVWTGVVTMFQPAPKMRSAPARAAVHVTEEVHRMRRRVAAATLPRTARTSATRAPFSPRRHRSPARWKPSTRKEPASSKVNPVPTSSGAPRTSSPIRTVSAALEYAARRACWLTRRKLCSPSSTPATIRSVPTSWSEDGPRSRGAMATNPARMRAAVLSPSRSRIARHHYPQSSGSSIRPRSHAETR